MYDWNVATNGRTPIVRRSLEIRRRALITCGAVAVVLSIAVGASRASAAATDTLVSAAASNGHAAQGISLPGSISADDRYVAYVSWAANIVSGDTNGDEDVFVRDLTGTTSVRASVSTAGVQANGLSDAPVISQNGRWVAFQSVATNLSKAPDTNRTWDVFVRNLDTDRTRRVSVSTSGAQGSQASLQPSISADGERVVFQSDSPNLARRDTNRASDVFERDQLTGITRRVSRNPAGKQFSGGAWCGVISPDGQYVAFATRNAGIGIRDLATKTTRMLRNLSGCPVGFSADDRYLVEDAASGGVLVRDLHQGGSTTVSIDPSGSPFYKATATSISNDGRYVAMDAVIKTSRGVHALYVRDLQDGTTFLASDGEQTNGIVSPDGAYAVFSTITPLDVTLDHNSKKDVYLRGPLP